MYNLKQFQPPRPEFKYQVDASSKEMVPMVKIALRKFCTRREFQEVERYRRSVISAESLISDFMRCDIERFKVVKDEIYYKALGIVKRWFSPPDKVKPVRYEDTAKYPWTISTSVEAPFSTDPKLIANVQKQFNEGLLPTGRMSFSNLFDHVYATNKSLVSNIKQDVKFRTKYRFWCTSHARSHLVHFEDPDKVRMVYGVPKLTLQVELMFLWPYFNFLRKGETPILWGYETMIGGQYRLATEVSNWAARLETFLCLDWSRFDKLAQFDVIRDIHDSWAKFIDFEHGYQKSKGHSQYEDDSVQLRRLFQWMTDAIKFTPVRLPDGSEYIRQHASIASGLLQTQVLDTWYNALMIVTCLLALGIEVDDNTFAKFLGDDSLIGLPTLIPESDYLEFLEKFGIEAKRRFGAILSVKKSLMKPTLQGCHVLGYTYDNAVPKRDEIMLLAQLAYPERHWDYDRMAARAIGIAYASCGQSQLVYNVCKDVFDLCISKGAVPDPLGHSWLMFTLEHVSIDLSKFPEFQDLSSKLFTPVYERRELDEIYWPSDYFVCE